MPHALRMPTKTPLASDKIDVPAACTVPFRPYCGGVVMRTRNVSEYMLVLALCLVLYVLILNHLSPTSVHAARPCCCICVETESGVLGFEHVSVVVTCSGYLSVDHGQFTWILKEYCLHLLTYWCRCALSAHQQSSLVRVSRCRTCSHHCWEVSRWTLSISTSVAPPAPC